MRGRQYRTFACALHIRSACTCSRDLGAGRLFRFGRRFVLPVDAGGETRRSSPCRGLLFVHGADLREFDAARAGRRDSPRIRLPGEIAAIKVYGVDRFADNCGTAPLFWFPLFMTRFRCASSLFLMLFADRLTDGRLIAQKRSSAGQRAAGRGGGIVGSLCRFDDRRPEEPCRRCWHRAGTEGKIRFVQVRRARGVDIGLTKTAPWKTLVSVHMKGRMWIVVRRSWGPILATLACVTSPTVGESTSGQAQASNRRTNN